MNPQIILLGAPGSGKGTQASRLVSTYKYNHISTGDLLRTEMAKNSEIGKRITSIMNAGKLVDDQTVLELLRLNCDLAKGSYIFDGYPRTIEQAHSLDEIVLKKTKAFAFYLEVDFKILTERLTNRRTCTNKACGEIFNLVSKKPVKAGTCDKCGASLMQRKDDNEETVTNRMDVFKNTISPILSYYEKKGILKRINAGINPETTFSEMRKIIEA